MAPAVSLLFAPVGRYVATLQLGRTAAHKKLLRRIWAAVGGKWATVNARESGLDGERSTLCIKGKYPKGTEMAGGAVK